MQHERVRVIVEIALAVALAAVLNSLKIWRMPNAGTVSFVMLPIVLIALRRGLLAGVITGAVYGVVDFFVDPFPPVHWVQPLLDYPIAFAAVGLAGLMSGPWHAAFAEGRRGAATLCIVAGCAIGGIGRYAAHVASGALFFGEYAPPGQPVLLYSALYNLYVPLSTLLAVVAAVVLMPILEKAAPARD